MKGLERIICRSDRRYGTNDRILLVTGVLITICAGAALIHPQVQRARQEYDQSKIAESIRKHNSPAPDKKNPESAATLPTYPSDILDLTNWYLTLPVGCPAVAPTPCTSKDNAAGEIIQPALASFANPNFYINRVDRSVVFRADIDGATTTGSTYPRSELREMANRGTAHASWSTTSGRHMMIITEAITHLPTIKAQVVSAQIHDSSNDVIEIIADGPGIDQLSANQARICVRYIRNQSKETPPCLDPNYVLGSYFTLVLAAFDDSIKIWYVKGLSTPDLDTVVPTWQEQYSGSGDYFKAGAYVQSNLKQGDTPGMYGEVQIRKLAVIHN